MTRATLRPAAALAALTVMAALAGCYNPFSPRWEPAAGLQTTGQGASVSTKPPVSDRWIVPPTGPPILLDYRSPEATLRTMAAGLQAKGPGALAWLRAFADSTRPEDGSGYHHFFDPADLEAFESSCGCVGPTDWRLPHEQIFYLTFMGVRPGDNYRIEWEEVAESPDPPPGDTHALLHRHYRVLATSPDGYSTMVIGIGFADLLFVKVSADRWLITRWVDHVDPDVGVNPADPEQLTLGRRRLEASL
jgi:hypothetical protein